MLSIALPSYIPGLAPTEKSAAAGFVKREDYDRLAALIDKNIQNPDALKSIGAGISKSAPKTITEGSGNALYHLAKCADGKPELEKALYGALSESIPKMFARKDFSRFNDALRLTRDHPFLAPAIGPQYILFAATLMRISGYPSDLLTLQKLRPQDNEDLNEQMTIALKGYKIIEISRLRDHTIPANTAIMIPTQNDATQSDVRAQSGQLGGLIPSDLVSAWKKAHPRENPKPLIEGLKRAAQTAGKNPAAQETLESLTL